MKSLIVAAIVAMGPMHTCSDIGGYTDACWSRMADMPQGFRMRARHYYSGGTWPIAKAGCVYPGAVFHFHAAHNMITGTIDEEGNNMQRSVLASLPSMLAHLEARGAFRRVNPHVTLTATQIASIEPRVRLCGR